MFFCADFMVLEIWRQGDDGEPELVYEEESPGSVHATKLLGIITKVYYFVG